MTVVNNPVTTVGELLAMLDNIDASCTIHVVGFQDMTLFFRDQDQELHVVPIKAQDTP